MKALSLFSGAGGLDLGLERAGIEAVAFCEVEEKPRLILEHHWPDTECYPDVAELDVQEFLTTHGSVELVHGGSPCQDLSVAGKREGLAGSRSGLFWHQCRIADGVGAPWVLWENVAGALNSHKGADFAAVLWGITGAFPDVPDGGWRKSGFIAGPKRWAVWRVLDARYFRVAQRRRRVFVVGGPLDRVRPEVLLEPEGVHRDSAEDDEAGSEATGDAGAGAAGSGRGRVARGRVLADEGVTQAITRGLHSGGPDAQWAQAGWLVPDHTGTVTTNWWKGPGNTQVEEGAVQPFVKTHRASHSEDPEKWTEQEVAPTVTAGEFTEVRSPTVAVNVYPESGQGADLRASEATLAMSPTAIGQEHDRGTRIASELGVRRLCPVEVERLMGWPDDWTKYGGDGSVISDSARYKACGNGVVASVAEWIGRRLIDAATD